MAGWNPQDFFSRRLATIASGCPAVRARTRSSQSFLAPLPTGATAVSRSFSDWRNLFCGVARYMEILSKFGARFHTEESKRRRSCQSTPRLGFDGYTKRMRMEITEGTGVGRVTKLEPGDEIGTVPGRKAGALPLRVAKLQPGSLASALERYRTMPFRKSLQWLSPFGFRHLG